MAFIISANYNDRSSPQKWLVRDENGGREDTVPSKQLVGYEVTFERSSKWEEALGCTRVARAQSWGVSGTADRGWAREMYFSCSNFYDSKTHLPVARCSVLLLEPDGKMYYIP